MAYRESRKSRQLTWILICSWTAELRFAASLKISFEISKFYKPANYKPTRRFGA